MSDLVERLTACRTDLAEIETGASGALAHTRAGTGSGWGPSDAAQATRAAAVAVQSARRSVDRALFYMAYDSREVP